MKSWNLDLVFIMWNTILEDVIHAIFESYKFSSKTRAFKSSYLHEVSCQSIWNILNFPVFPNDYENSLEINPFFMSAKNVGDIKTSSI